MQFACSPASASSFSPKTCVTLEAKQQAPGCLSVSAGPAINWCLVPSVTSLSPRDDWNKPLHCNSALEAVMEKRMDGRMLYKNLVYTTTKKCASV